MFALYDPDTGIINATAEVADTNGYIETLNKVGRSFVIVEGRLAKPMHHYRAFDGVIFELPEMAIAAPDVVAVGDVFVLEGVPEGAVILRDGAEVGIMDGSGNIELSFDMAGSYRLTFLKDGYIPREIAIEARA